MPVDKSNARLGLLKWPLLVAMVLGQLYMTFLPPPEIGSVIMVAVKATAIASQVRCGSDREQRREEREGEHERVVEFFGFRFSNWKFTLAV